MNILVLNGSPRKNGNTEIMADEFIRGAQEAGHTVAKFNVGSMDIAPCIACESCFKNDGVCFRKDDMQQIYPVLDEAEMIVLGSPIYYHFMTGPLQNAISRFYAFGYPKELKKSMLLLSSGSPDVYSGAINAYQRSFIRYMKLEDMGVFTAAGDEHKSEALLNKLREVGAAL